MRSTDRHNDDNLSLLGVTGGGLSTIALALALSGGQDEPQSPDAVVPVELSEAPQVETTQKTRLEASAIFEGEAESLKPSSTGNNVWHGPRALTGPETKAFLAAPSFKDNFLPKPEEK